MTDSFIEECDHPVQRQERLAQREGGYKAQKARLPWTEGGDEGSTIMNACMRKRVMR